MIGTTLTEISFCSPGLTVPKRQTSFLPIRSARGIVPDRLVPFGIWSSTSTECAGLSPMLRITIVYTRSLPKVALGGAIFSIFSSGRCGPRGASGWTMPSPLIVSSGSSGTAASGFRRFGAFVFESSSFDLALAGSDGGASVSLGSGSDPSPGSSAGGTGGSGTRILPLIEVGGLSAKRFSSSSSADFFADFLVGESFLARALANAGPSRLSSTPLSSRRLPASWIGCRRGAATGSFAVSRSISASTAWGVSSNGS